MNRNLIAMSVCLGLILGSHAHAGDIEYTGSGDGGGIDIECHGDDRSSASCEDGGSNISVDGGLPTTECIAKDGYNPPSMQQPPENEELDVFQECLEDLIPAPYSVTILTSPNPGLRILNSDGTEVSGLCANENSTDIRWLRLTVAGAGLRAKVGLFEPDAQPLGGTVEVTVDGAVYWINTTPSQTGSDVNQALYFEIRGKLGSAVTRHGDSHLIIESTGGSLGINSVSFHSDDDGLARSILELTPFSSGIGPASCADPSMAMASVMPQSGRP
ncbi:hypothetical protein ABI59_12795 [Acidobacteria bacterium Mor1]|nr:hypothetical protein ABI59_12795 [Acidobacteria bacterium Mor1]